MPVDPSHPTLTTPPEDIIDASALPVVVGQPTLPAILNDKIERAAAYARAARSAATRRAYDFDWAIFTVWCDAHGLIALPRRRKLSRCSPATRRRPGSTL